MKAQSPNHRVKEVNETDENRLNAIHWYLAAAKPKQELRAVEHLANQKIQSFCPQINVEKVVANKKQVVKEVLFKGYVFIKIAQNDPHWHKIRSTRGIRDWIRFSGRIATIPNSLVNELHLNEQSKKRFVFNKMHAGDKVRILSGPFEGLEGIFEKDDGDVRAILLLNFLGQSNRVMIEKSQLSAD